MPILNYTDHKTFRGRLVVGAIYASLLLGGVTMVYPFLVTLTGSLSNPFDYERRSPLPRFLWSREDRFMRTLCTYFPPGHRQALRQLRAYFPDLPADWQIWAQIGDDRQGTDAWAKKQLQRLEDPTTRQHLARMAADYGEFMQTWDVRETILAYDQRQVAPFLRRRYGTLDRFNAAWEFSIDDFYKVTAEEWAGEPIDLPNYVPEPDARYEDLLLFREEYRRNRFTPFLGGPEAPASYLRPAALRFLWEDFMAAADPTALPFPVVAPAKPPANRFVGGPSGHGPPASRTADPDLIRHWHRFLRTVFPLRHVEIVVTEARRRAFRDFLRERFRNLDYLNQVLGQSLRDWSDLPLTPTVPLEPPVAKVWMDFLRTKIPPSEWRIRDTLPEQAFQKFALAKYGSLEGVNRAYGLNLSSLQQLRIPFGEALLVTFAHREWHFTWDQATANFRSVADFLFHRGRAVQNTILLVGLSLLVTLTVNPLAGYALSRFQLRATEKVLIFCLATMAFPAAVSAIPGFLLLRDLHLLNTFAALVLPGAANGMSIFLLKGFFDSLPRELYEAAAIDGAPEWMVFYHISLPLVKPILAVSMLNAFLQAYNAWEWALIVCQDRKMWTLAVWTYQFSQTASGQQPFTVMAAFVLTSIPVLLVFLFCQKVILRGIILPQMK
jgi:ABC-type glycerol-3-phosphate transport system permease component